MDSTSETNAGKLDHSHYASDYFKEQDEIDYLGQYHSYSKIFRFLR